MDTEQRHTKTEQKQKSQPTEIVLEDHIIKGVYSSPQEIFRNKTRFEMVLSEPSDKFKFQQVMDKFKGRYICKNPSCLDCRQGEVKIKKVEEDSSEDDQRLDGPKTHKTWMNWHNKNLKNTFIPQVKTQEQEQTQKRDRYNNEPVLKKIGDNSVKTKLEKKSQIVEKEIQKQSKNTKWSSSLSYVIFHYRSFPQSLQHLKEVYDKLRNEKCQIYFYIQLTGQICKTCDSNAYCYPFFGKKQLRRISKNFSNFIYNKIYNKKILRYRPCDLKSLVKHKKQLCQACKLGICRKRCLSG